MRKKQVSAAQFKNSDWDAKDDTGEKGPGRENPGGHFTQCSHDSLLHEHGNDKLCHITSDCPFQVSRAEEYESAVFPETQEKAFQDRGRMLAKVSGNLFVSWISQRRIGIRKLG